ncbi:hypothetical protein [Allorhodopirellula heiligendammensis]|uniref:Uncharacterized protein n=1 Tax=Allorhodopirellula heiligendammensis TaxID=2714739 RepID=A0A5C6BWL8_9BACT|nr:hypothetical protein [Allorhodopirellula heiligendammensis]TWU15891.1 hypothetical protein Poly21_30940 [Allorhodopirellula heiligendammensis]
MNRLFLLVTMCLTLCVISETEASDMPSVSVKQFDYRAISKGNSWTGRQLSDAIPLKSVSRVVLTELPSKSLSSQLGRELPERDIRNIASKFTEILFSATGPIEKWSQLAEEGKSAELIVVTSDGEIYFVDVLQNMVSSAPTAFILRGDGFSVRVPIVRDPNEKNAEP